MFSIIDREAMEREEAELKAALAAQEAEKKATIPLVPSSRVMPPAPPSSRWDGTDTLRTPTTDTVASEPAPKESKSLQSWFFTEEAETDRFAEPEPPPSAKSESFFSGWTIFETLFSSRTNTKDKATTTTGFFSGPIPRRTGWLFIDMFLSEKTDTVARQPGFSLLTKFLLLAVPLIAFAGYYQYAQVSGATILGKTLSNSVNLERGLVGHWTFDGGDMTAVVGSRATSTDVSGNNNHIRHTSATADKRVSGKIGQALQINSGINSKAPASSSLNDLSTITVAMWVRPVFSFVNNFFGFSNPLINKSLLESNGWALSASTTEGTIEFRYNRSSVDGIWKSSRNQYNVNEWVFITVIYDGSSTSNDPKIYINGSSVMLTEVSTPSGTLSSDTAIDLRLSYDSITDHNGASYDDVRIYNRVLTAKEIERLYKMGEGVKINTNTIPAGSTLEDGLVGYWSFNGQDMNGNSALDRSGNNSTGTLTNGPTKVAGKVGQGLKFINGTNQFVNAGSAAILDNISPMTISGWIKPNSLGTYPYILSKASPPTRGWDLILSSGRLQLEVFFSGNDGVWRGPQIRTNEWQHIAIVYDHSVATNVPVFYINGVATTTTVSTQSTGTYASDATDNLGIGNDTAFTSSGFDGTLDEVRIYNRALSADEVAQLYRSGSGVTINAAPQGGGGEPAFTCGVSTVEDADANVYDTIEIGTQCWMQQNMRVGTRINVATNQTNNSTIEKWCYSDTDSNCTSNNPNQPDGGLYQWDEAMQYSTTPGAQGICPSGWHIPTHDELTTLERAVCTSGSCVTDFPYDTTTTGYRGTTESTKLKPNGSSGFEGNLSGAAYSNSFNNRGLGGYLWSSSESGANAWYRNFVSFFGQVYRASDSKTLGHSVRCLKD